MPKVIKKTYLRTGVYLFCEILLNLSLKNKMKNIFMIFFIPFLFLLCSCSNIEINEQEILENTKEGIIEYCFNKSTDTETLMVDISIVKPNGFVKHLTFESVALAKASNKLQETDTWDILHKKIWGGYEYYRIQFINNKVDNIKKRSVTDF